MLKILIADDHAIVRRGIRDILIDEYRFARIEEVADSASMIKKLMQEKWDIIISDISMPGRSGLEALAQVKELAPRIPVLIVSVYPEEQYAVRVLKAGASGYLNKELAPEELIKAVSTILAGKKYITPSAAENLLTSIKDQSDRPLHEHLSDREFEVFRFLAQGLSISDIANNMLLSSTTISTYRARIISKMQFHSNADIVRYALGHQLI
jgi:two-component system, NarL family, invasion response regulator UvrY